MCRSCRPWTSVIIAGALLVGCNALFGIDDLSYDRSATTSPTGGTGGNGGASSTAGAGGTAGSAGVGGSGGRAGSGGSAGAGGAGGAVGAGGAGGTPGPVTCTEQYGTIAQYVFCDQTPAQCRFFAQLGGSTCSALCRAEGGECLGAFHNAAPQSCALGAASTCQEALNDAICVCSRGCGGGPPCATGEICTAGSCT